MARDSAETGGVEAMSRFREFRASKWFIGITIFGTAFTDGFLYGMVVPVLPFSLVIRSGVDPDDVQFWHSALLIIFGASMVVSCALLSWSTKFNYPRRAPLFIGLLGNFASTVMFMLVSSTWLLAVSRVLQGLASGFLLCAGLAIIAEEVPTEEAGSWIGFTVSGQDVGILLSPLLAGLVYEHAGYYMVFVMGLCILGVLTILVTLMILDESPGRGDHESNGAVESREATESEPLLRNRKPSQIAMMEGGLLPTFKLLKSPQIATAIYGCFVAIILITTFDGTLPLYVKQTYNWKSGLAGSTFLAISGPSVFGPVIGSLSDRYGSRRIALFGIVVTVVCEGLMFVTMHNTLAAQIGLFALLVGVGIGYNSFLVALAANLSASVEAIHKQHPDTTSISALLLQVYTLEGYAFSIGIMLGPLIGGLLLHSTNWGVECGVAALVVATTAIPVFMYTRP